MNNELSINIITTTEKFYALRDEWNNLLENCNQDTIFLKWEWLFSWWQVYMNKSKRLHICVAREGDQLIGIAPLYMKNEYCASKLYFLGANVICSDYLDFILLKNRETEILFAMLQYLNNADTWDVFTLRNMPSWSTNIPIIRSFFNDYRIVINKKHTVCHYINLQENWDTIYGNYHSRLKRNITVNLRKLKDLYNVSYYEPDSITDLTNLIPTFINLSVLRFEKKMMKSPFLDSKFADFHRKIMTSFNESGLVKLGFLKVNEELIAGIYMLKYKNKIFYYQSGFNPSWQRFSPGSLLFHFVIKDAHEKGIREFDFLQGNHDYKNNWTNSRRYNARLQIFNNSAVSNYLYWRAGMGRLKSVIRRYLKEKRPSK